MCVLLCANPTVREWLDVDVARAQRQWLQLAALCPADPYAPPPADEHELSVIDARNEGALAGRVDAAVILCRRLVTHVYRNRVPRNFGGAARASAKEWHKPLQALADAWRRFLSFVGWR